MADDTYELKCQECDRTGPDVQETMCPYAEEYTRCAEGCRSYVSHPLEPCVLCGGCYERRVRHGS